MRLWIDNTGLQSAGQCLEGKAAGDIDVKGLLQLGTLLVFSQNLLLNSVETDRVAEKSSGVVERLVHLGVDKAFIQVTGDIDTYLMACESAADTAAADLETAFKSQNSDMLRLEPPDLPEEIRIAQTDFVRVANTPLTDAQLSSIKAKAKRNKAAGAIAYMLAHSPKLRAAVTKLIDSSGHWSDIQTYQLNAFLRYYLNDALAKQYESFYTPAVARAQLIRMSNDYVLNRLTKLTDEAVSKLRRVPIAVPALTSSLVQRSKGNPAAFIESAVELRERTKELRSELKLIADKLRKDTPEIRFEIDRDVKDLVEALEMDLGLRDKPKLLNGIDIEFVLGIPALGVNLGQVREWSKYRARRKKIAVLTEISKFAAFLRPYEEEQAYRRLQDASGIKRP